MAADAPQAATAATPGDEAAAGGHSCRRLNRLAKALGCRSYLEIGVETGKTLLSIEVAERTGVDPEFQFDWQALDGQNGLQLHPCSSDSFFSRLAPERRFDLIFVDGLHTFEQTYRDILNSLRHSHPGTVIVIDDTVPSDVFSTCRDFRQCCDLRAMILGGNDESWHGDTYKVIPLLTVFNSDLQLLTLITDGNPQTILWRPAQTAEEDGIRTMQAMWAVQNLAAADYLWFLENLALFQPVSETEGLQIVIDSLSG